MANHTRRMRSALLAGCLSAASLALLVACGGSGGGHSDGKGGTSDHVASIGTPSTGSGGGSSATSSSDAGRPQLRMDTSPAEAARLDAVYFGCLHDHGVPSGHKPGSGNAWSPSGDATKYPAQYKACESKLPLQPPEEDPAKNPHYADDFRAEIKCLNDGGLKVRALPDLQGWNYNGSTSMSEAQEDKLQRRCELQSYKMH